MGEVVQVTIKPVNFTNEGKLLFKMLPKVTDDVVGALWALEHAIRDLENWDEDVDQYGIVQSLNQALKLASDAHNAIKYLVEQELLKPDLDETRAIQNNLLNAISAINNALRQLPVHSEDERMSVNNQALTAMTALSMARTDLERLCHLYFLDPPEFNAGGLAKGAVGGVVGVGAAVALCKFKEIALRSAFGGKGVKPEVMAAIGVAEVGIGTAAIILTKDSVNPMVKWGGMAFGATEILFGGFTLTSLAAGEWVKNLISRVLR